jgi:hypothetical protein
MKEQSIRRILIAASMFASFVTYLCLSVADVTPFVFIVALCASALLFVGLQKHTFTTVKLFTQKAE